MNTPIDTGTNELLCSLDERVALITFNRPERKNALSDNLTPALRQILFELNTNQDVGCIVITGAGNAFCAGGDVSGMGGASKTERPKITPTVQDRIKTLQHKQETLTLRLFEHAKPTIASLPGPAVGAGMCIALACDIRVGAESAFIGTGYRNVGFSGDYGGSWLLTQLVGVAKAKELFFTGRRVKSKECLELGLFNQVVPDDELHNTTMELANQIASGPPIALGYMKENINKALELDLRGALAQEADRLMRCAETNDHKEAVKAFMQKRAPVFTGD